MCIRDSQYSDYDKTVRKYRDGGSFTTTLNGNYSIKDIWNFTGNFTTNRFANPQGSISWNLSTNVGIQKKFFNKKFIVTLNFIDPCLLYTSDAADERSSVDLGGRRII